MLDAMQKSKIFKHAHFLTRKTIKQYPEANYAVTFGAAIKGLILAEKRKIADYVLTSRKNGKKNEQNVFFDKFHFDLEKFVFVKKFGESDEEFLANVRATYLQMRDMYKVDNYSLNFVDYLFVKKFAFIEGKQEKNKVKRTSAQSNIITHNDIILHVPYSDREIAKKAGAKWHPTKKRWYYKDAKNLPKELYKYLPKNLDGLLS